MERVRDAPVLVMAAERTRADLCASESGSNPSIAHYQLEFPIGFSLTESQESPDAVNSYRIRG